MVNKKEITDRVQTAAEKTMEMYSMPNEVPYEMEESINFLRQWLNEDRNCQPLVTNKEIWHWLKDGVNKINKTNT